MASGIDQSDRSRFAMLVDALVAVPDQWKELAGYRFDSETDSGPLTEALQAVLSEFERVPWQKLGPERRPKIHEIAQKLMKEPALPEKIGGETLAWALQNQSSRSPKP